MIRAICVDGRYKSVKLGEIYTVTFMNYKGVMVDGGERLYEKSTFSYVAEDGTPLTASASYEKYRRELPKYHKHKKGI